MISRRSLPLRLIFVELQLLTQMSRRLIDVGLVPRATFVRGTQSAVIEEGSVLEGTHVVRVL